MKYRVSNVEAFRKWEADPDAEPEDLDRLIADIQGVSSPSQAMAAGTAFHACLERAVAGIDFDTVGHGEFVFTFAGDFDIEVTPIRELRASKTYLVDGVPIVISGQVDAIDGLRIEDHKTTGRFDPDRFLTGYQWRLYLDIFGARQFRWNVFEMKEVDSIEPAQGFDLPRVQYEVFAQHRLEQFAYPGMEADCVALVTRFARFVREHVEVRALPVAA